MKIPSLQSNTCSNVKPCVEPEFEASEAECNSRKEILKAISAQQNTLAWDHVVACYTEFKSSCDEVQRSQLPTEPPLKFAVNIYYD